MRVPRKAVPIQPLTYIWEKHKEIARLEVTGMKPIDISKKLGMTPCRISIIMNSPIYKEYRDSLSSKRDEEALDIRKEILKGAEKGVQHLVDFLDDNEIPKPKRARIAQDFLDRSGFGKTSTVNVNKEVTVLTGSKIEELKEKQRALLAGIKVINGESKRIE